MKEVITKKISEVLWHVGISDEEIVGFRKNSYTDNGVMYSTYILSIGDGYALIGTPPLKHLDRWVDKIREITDIDKLRYLIVFGNEYDREVAKRLITEGAKFTIIATSKCLLQLREYLGNECKYIEIREKRVLQLGERLLDFRLISGMAWHKSLYVVDKDEAALFTSDIFGSYFATEYSTSEDLFENEKAYNKTILKRGIESYAVDVDFNGRQTVYEEAKKLCENESIRMICPSFGPIWNSDISRLFECIENNKPVFDSKVKRVAIISDGMGYTRDLANEIEKGINEDESNPIKIQVVKIDLESMSRLEAINNIQKADFYLFGASDIGGDVSKRIWDIATSLKNKDVNGIKCSVFGNGKPDGVYTESLYQRLEWLGMDITTARHIASGILSEDGLKAAYEYGYDISCIVRGIPNERRPKLVKCLVCGEIFDASLGICPVCGVGLDQCVPADQDESDFKNDTNKTYLIIGGGVAAVAAAEAIRLRDETGKIIIITKEKYYPINRPMLTKNLNLIDEAPPELFIHDEAWYADKKIDIRIGCEATKLDADARIVNAKTIDNNNLTFNYDELIYAAGAECFLPPFKGCEKEGVFTIRHFDDSKGLIEKLKIAKSAVVIGGGVLGLEAASEIMRRGVTVTVLEAAPQIIGRQVDGSTAEFVRNKMKSFGVDCYEGVTIEEITGKDSVTGVKISDGRVFEAEIVLISCGNRGNNDLAYEAGIEVKRSIVVDEHMKTNKEHIYACGDCAQFADVNFQLWQEALAQGRVAGANAAGEKINYEASNMGMSFEGFGTTVFSLGDAGKNPDVSYKKLNIVDDVDESRQTYWFVNGGLEGAIVVGKNDLTGDVITWINTKARHEEVIG